MNLDASPLQGATNGGHCFRAQSVDRPEMRATLSFRGSTAAVLLALRAAARDLFCKLQLVHRTGRLHTAVLQQFCLCVVAVVVAADAGLDSLGRKISTLLLFAGEVLAHRSVRLLLSPARATMLARQKAIRIPLKLAKSSFRYRSSSGNLTTLINMKLD